MLVVIEIDDESDHPYDNYALGVSIRINPSTIEALLTLKYTEIRENR